MEVASNEKQYVFISAFVSIVVYVSILFGIFFYLGYSKDVILRFTSKKDNFLDVTIVERKTITAPVPQKKRVIKKKKQPKRVVKKKTTPVKKASPKAKSSAKQTTPDLKNLFKSINTKKLPVKKEIATPAPKVKSRLKPSKQNVVEAPPKNEAKKLTSSLALETKQAQTISQSTGQYDEFRGKVSEILQSNWQETIDTVSGSEAVVKIMIDNFGNFSYNIVSMSYNDAFNAKLREFLEDMSDEVFPPYTGGGIFEMNFKFKDILE